MAKYNREELRSMARIVMDDRAAGGQQSTMLILTVSMMTGLDPQEVVRRIKELRDG